MMQKLTNIKYLQLSPIFTYNKRHLLAHAFLTSN